MGHSHDIVERKRAPGQGNQLGFEVLYIRSMGKALTVTGVFLNDEDANRFIESQKERHGVVACPGSLVMTAKIHDHGIKIKE